MTWGCIKIKSRVLNFYTASLAKKKKKTSQKDVGNQKLDKLKKKKKEFLIIYNNL